MSESARLRSEGARAERKAWTTYLRRLENLVDNGDMYGWEAIKRAVEYGRTRSKRYDRRRRRDE